MLAAGFHSVYLLVSFLVVQLVTAQAPKALQPPEGQVLLLHLQGKGKQMYVCQTANGVSTWKFKAPEATLYSPSGELAGHHFAGPAWESTDGSRVVGKVIASTPSPEADSVPGFCSPLQLMKAREFFPKSKASSASRPKAA